jgi:hypothetical protein
MIARLRHGNGDDMEEYYKQEVEKLEEEFNKLLPQLVNKQVVFIFRLAKAGEPKVRSLRRPLQSSFVYVN